MKINLRKRKNQSKPDNSYGSGTFDRLMPPETSEIPRSEPRDISLVFFGSGPVAAKSLELLAQNFSVEAVVTKPKPAHHHGAFPILDLAESLKLSVHTVSNKAQLSELIGSRPFHSRLGVLIDFGIIVNQDVIDYFPLGIVNSHFSILPQWRGADPITFSILSGQDKTGVSLMLIDADMDTGKIITQKSLSISSDATTKTLTAELINLSRDLLVEYLPKYIDGSVQARNQPHPDRATYSRKLTKQDGIIDWTKAAPRLEREIRAFLEWPKSTTAIGGKEVILTKVSVVNVTGKPGLVEIKDKNLIIYAGQQALSIEKLKPAGKKEMTAEAFLAGYGYLLK